MQEIICPKEGNAYSVAEVEEVDTEEIEGITGNNKLLFKPEFIPFYLNEVKKYNFSNTEGLVYGFIRFYLKNNPNGKFYFTNDQLAYMLDVSSSTISNSIVKVCNCGEFKVSYKVKANGGTFRLLESSESDSEKVKSETLRKLRANNNKIKENSINTPREAVGDKPQSYGSPDITKLQNFLKEHYPIPLEGITDRRRLHNVIQVLTKRKNQDEWMDDDWRKNFNTFINLYIPNTKEDYYARSVNKLLDKIKLWREYRGKLN
mgnify:FL=1